VVGTVHGPVTVTEPIGIRRLGMGNVRLAIMQQNIAIVMYSCDGDDALLFSL
jgi:hypothetical protein